MGNCFGVSNKIAQRKTQLGTVVQFAAAPALPAAQPASAGASATSTTKKITPRWTITLQPSTPDAIAARRAAEARIAEAAVRRGTAARYIRSAKGSHANRDANPKGVLGSDLWMLHSLQSRIVRGPVAPSNKQPAHRRNLSFRSSPW